MLTQKLQQKLLQKLSPQQIQLMKLLQIPTFALEQRIKQELEENPALEELQDATEDDERGDDPDVDADDADQETEGLEEEKLSSEEEFDIQDYFDDDEIPDYKLSANNTSPDDKVKEIPLVSGWSFHEFLGQQISLRVLTEKQVIIAKHIIGNFDDSGYLQREISSLVDDLAFAMNLVTDEQEVRDLLEIIQDFDPAGVGARNLQECLLIQLRRMNTSEKSVLHAIDILENHFDEFTKKHYDKIQSRARLSKVTLKKAIEVILKLNPKPGNSLSDTSKVSQYIIPDFIIHNNNGTPELTLNARNAPELRLSRVYQNMLKQYVEGKPGKQQKEAMLFVKQKVDAAKWFIDAIKQRQNTLYTTMHAIMDFQLEYFTEGDEVKLRPMILKDIADVVGLDISTISRVASSKYVQTPFGTFLLKSFFSESMETDSGEEVSTREVKKILQDCINAENKKKPVTDEKLMEILNSKGYNIARRTVAKYREQLGIPVARLRRGI